MKIWDAVVVGIGGMGSSACYHLAASGKSVLGLEQFDLAHNKGSSHGETRLIRKAYFEHPSYVPLLKRSYQLWDEIGHLTGKKLLHRTGLIIWGPKNGTILNGIRESAKLHGLSIDEFNASDGAKRFPLFSPPAEFHGIFESDGGFLEVENCVSAYAEQAQKLGAQLHFQETLRSWKSTAKGVEVVTDRETYFTRKLILTVGPWAENLLRSHGISLAVHRAPLFWYPATPAHTEQAKFPCFAFDLPYGFIYGFPSLDGSSLKLALHHPGAKVDNPSEVDRSWDVAETSELQRCIRDHLPKVQAAPLRGAVCMYTMSKDENFVLDFLPGNPDVVFGCGFSGHGFKFASVIGEILSDLALRGKTTHPIDFLRLRP